MVLSPFSVIRDVFMASEEVKEGGRGGSRAWPSAEGFAVGLTLPGGSLAGKEEYGGRQGVRHTGGKKLRRKLIK